MEDSIGALLASSLELRHAAQAAHKRADKAADADVAADRAERALARAREAQSSAREASPPPAECQGASLPVRRVRDQQAAAVKAIQKENWSPLAWMRPKAAPVWPRQLYLRVHGGTGLPVAGGGEGAAGGEVGRVAVRVTNATTGGAHQLGGPTALVRDAALPGDLCGCFAHRFEAFLVTVTEPHDTVAVEVVSTTAIDGPPLGTAIVPLTNDIVCHDKITLPMGGSQLVVECFWVENACFKREVGEFYYRVTRRGGAVLCKEPSWDAPKTNNKMSLGELLKSEERLEDVSDGIVYIKASGCTSEHVRTHTRGAPALPPALPLLLSFAGSPISADRDSCGRSGWLFEALGDERWLKPVAPPQRRVGQFFYRVARRSGARLYSKASADAALQPTVYAHGTVLEASQMYTPVGSTVTFVKIDIRSSAATAAASTATAGTARPAAYDRNDPTAELTFEEVGCPEGTTIEEEQGHFVFRVTVESGILVRDSPHVTAKPGEALRQGTAFAATRRVCVRYEGLGDVVFVQRAQDQAWVRATKAGLSLLELVLDRVEQGPFTYVVVHENGVVVRSNADLHAPPALPHTIMPVRRVFQVSERVQKAEDIVSSPAPTVFLRLADTPGTEGREGWVFERRGSAFICQDVTERARLAGGAGGAMPPP
ncbi:hypothetical protein JKP88DRAFT_293977 [Tribonema minus]|uniref:Uncharacterized protein n=1 Tax=Tribonema minus TaxID=303371 RepID=A0A836CNR4_9STRA|nr:hypothetical protein JKP88DRAFT_293977 [Tribonema minus]